MSRAQRIAFRFVPLVTALAASIALIVWALSGPTTPAGRPRYSAAPQAGRKPALRATTTEPSLASTTSTPPTTSPGSLPQTGAFPSSTTPQFRAEMSALWTGIVTGSSAAAMPAFFPEQAYVQIKTIPDPQGDYENRLVDDYALDIAAAHRLVGSEPAPATLVAVNVPAQYGHWVPPGVCDNVIGYFEVANSRVVYKQNGVVRSFGIASLISWRGVWYVVHLGAVLRSSSTGVVDDPETGAGSSAPSSTC